MDDAFEYQIYIGCHDRHTRGELVKEQELREMVVSFFRRKKIDFSVLSAKGGYRHDDGSFVVENTLCIDIIGALEMDIIGLARSLSMFMNQENVLVTRSPLKRSFR
ncbi:MAG: hypothetical protein E7427_07280 [Ruminococcaceae bacterium]|jgi:hypothetical protein|nr:hypothetical protein [Oscillospiraceae bacterium]